MPDEGNRAGFRKRGRGGMMSQTTLIDVTSSELAASSATKASSDTVNLATAAIPAIVPAQTTSTSDDSPARVYLLPFNAYLPPASDHPRTFANTTLLSGSLLGLGGTAPLRVPILPAAQLTTAANGTKRQHL